MLTSLYNSEPKGNILIVIFIYVATSESTLQDGRLDTLNSQIHPLMIILLQERDEEEYNDQIPLPYISKPK